MVERSINPNETTLRLYLGVSPLICLGKSIGSTLSTRRCPSFRIRMPCNSTNTEKEKENNFSTEHSVCLCQPSTLWCVCVCVRMYVCFMCVFCIFPLSLVMHACWACYCAFCTRLCDRKTSATHFSLVFPVASAWSGQTM